jgi:hypothetical protein
MIYSLPERPAEELKRNLKCLQNCAQTDPLFRNDLKKLSKLQKSCCEPRRLFARAANARKTNAKASSSVYLRS